MIGPDSRYAASALYVDGTEEFIGTRQRIDIAPRPDDVFHTVSLGDRIDLIAWRYLGSPELWWIICDYNEIFFPLEIEPGKVLRLPSAEHVEMRIMG